jgi:MazG family protein
VVFHSEIAYEEGAFTVADVLDDLREKLVRRHPHVFGDVEVSSAEEVHANWERIKRAEKQTGVLDGIPKELPALARGAKVYRRAVEAGFRWDDIGSVLEKFHEEVDELRAEIERGDRDPGRIESEIGDVIFMAVCVAQYLGIEPESALRGMLDRFTSRFRSVEAAAERDGRDLQSLSPEEWGRYWEQAKKETA